MKTCAAIVDKICHLPLAARGETLRTVTPIAQGSSSEVWRITTDTASYALRILISRQGNSPLQSDVHIRTQLHAQGGADAAPVAAPVTHGVFPQTPTGENTGLNWILDCFIPGNHPERGHLPAQTCAGLGKLLSRLHRLECSGHGRPTAVENNVIIGGETSPIAGLNTRFSSPLPITVSDWAAHPFHRITGLHARILPFLHRIVEKIARAPMVVCHTDLHEGQLICEGDQLRALIDFADVTIADRRWDFGSLYYFHGDCALQDVIGAYCEADPQQNTHQSTLISNARLFSLCIALHHAARSVLPGKSHRFDVALAHIYRVLDRIETGGETPI